MENSPEPHTASQTHEDPLDGLHPMVVKVSTLEVLSWLRKIRPDLFRTVVRPVLPLDHPVKLAEERKP